MKSRIKRLTILLLSLTAVLLILLLFPLLPYESGKTERIAPSLSSPPSFEIYVATDMHYLSPSLHDGGEAFQQYIEAGDSKLLQYSDELMDAWAEQIIAGQPQAVILSGDITNNGEQASHRQLAEKLDYIERAGIQVLVIPGNHDILNPWARSFKGDRQYKTEFITADDFRQIYHSFGYGEALDSDPESLSYVAKITDQLWALMLDTCQYKNNLELGYPKTNGSLSGSTLKWIIHQTEIARNHGAEMITVMHHNLLDHTIFSSGFTLDNADKVFNVLNESNIHLTLSGHIHIQDIRSYQGLTDIATSSMEVYPYQFGVLEFDTAVSKVIYQTRSVDVEQWSESNGVRAPQLRQFKDYGRDFFHDQSYNKAMNALKDQGYNDVQIQNMAETMAELNLHYFAGTVNIIDEKWLSSPGMKLWEQAESGFMSKYMQSMAASAKENNHIEIHYSNTSP